MDEKIIKESLQGNAYALARLITSLEDWEKRAQIIKEIAPYTGKAFVLGITGPPGVGKSTLISRLTAHLRGLGFSIGLLCVDPTSPVSGGSLLGDRLRMEEHSLDPGVFIRSLAARDQLGGVSPTTREVIKLLDASGKDIIIVESVGAGQAQVDLKKIVDTVVLVLAPGLGDSIQMLKAGLMEIADIFVLNMADREEAYRTKRELETAASMFKADWRPPVVSTIATGNVGVAELYEAVAGHRKFLHESGLFDQRRSERNLAHTMVLVRELLKEAVETLLEENSGLRTVVNNVKAGVLDPYSAAEQIVDHILHSQQGG